MDLRLLCTSTLLASLLAAQRVTEGPEPNASAVTATGVACGNEAVGALSTTSDEDWFRLVLSTVSDLVLVTSPGSGVGCRDTVVTLLDGSGGPLRQSDAAVQSGWYSELSARALPPGLYYVAVAAGANAVPGSYQLDISCLPRAAGSTPGAGAAEAPEPNDPRAGGSPTIVSAPVRGVGNLTAAGVDGDWDFWRVLVPSESLLTVALSATANFGSSAADDPVVYLFDAATPPNALAGPFYCSEPGVWDVTVDARLGAGTYQVAVRGAKGSQAGGYFLDLRLETLATGSVSPGGCGGRSLSLATTQFGPGAPLVREQPRLGSSYSVTGSGLGSLGYCFHLIGLQGQYVDLTPLGAPGCALEVVPADVLFRLATTVGEASWTIHVPGRSSLLGTQLWSQVAVLDLSNPLGLTMSNRVQGVVGY